MVRRIYIICISIAFSLCVFFVVIGSRNTDTIIFQPFPETYGTLRSYQKTEGDELQQPRPMKPIDGSTNIEQILDNTRSKIKLDLRNYNFTYSGVHTLDDLLLESGGRPLRSIIVSTWRSGSSFLGAVLNAMPGSFYNFEPLSRYQSKQIQGPPRANESISEIKRMLKCDYIGMEDYFEYVEKNKLAQIKRNTRLWNVCFSKKRLCSDANFTNKFCKLFPFQSMKVVRLRLRFFKDLLEDNELNAKIVLLIRDPRGVMQSRQLLEFCQLGADCWNPEVLCADMISDYVQAGRIYQMYPDRLTVLRFEELALNPNKTTGQLFKFLRLSAMPSINEFLQTHTTRLFTTFPYSTFRVSRDVPFKWKSALTFDYVKELQGVCSEAMALWGYKLAHNASHMASDDFFPLEPYTLMQTTQ